jgi:SAM-dependent methyltransferase
MITSKSLAGLASPDLLRAICCPVCLADLAVDAASADRMSCLGCSAVYPLVDGLPILLVEDDNWRKKEDEISGEVAFNTETVPMSVHVVRNAFVDGNTAELLDSAGLDLSESTVLVVGCSMAELQFFRPRVRRLYCLDIVPSLALQALGATRRREIDASWICGDGEALPCDSEIFDAVIVRQALHHMLNYDAAVRELFRVCRTGGVVAIIDEPFGPPDAEAAPLSTRSDAHPLFDEVTVGALRQALALPGRAEDVATGPDSEEFKARDGYIDAVAGDNESLLADKYANLSLAGLVYALQDLSSDVRLFCPRQVGWVEGSGASLQFQHGPNPQVDLPLALRLARFGNASVVARKTKRAARVRDRRGLRAAALDRSLSMARA